MNVFVTGGTGFVGAYLLHYLLQRGDRVRALRRRSSPMLLVADIASQIEWVEADLLDQDALEDVLQGIDQVYHAAAMVSFHAADAKAMFKINIEGTANMVNASLATGVKKYIQISSVAALGRNANLPDVDENSPWENTASNTNYAISKFKSECEVWRGIEEGLNAAILNPSMILGAGYWHVGTNKFFQQVYKRFGYYPIGTSGFVDVRDVAKIAIALMDSNISGERFVVSAENIAYEQLLGQIADLLHVRRPSRRLAPWMAGLAWRAAAVWARVLGRPPVITREVVQTMQSTYRYNNQKLIQQLGYSYIPIETTLQQTAERFLRSINEKTEADLLPL